MTQKVVSVIVKADLEAKSTFQELEFPKVAEILDQGYFVKEVHQADLTLGGASTTTRAHTVLTFILQKN